MGLAAVVRLLARDRVDERWLLAPRAQADHEAFHGSPSRRGGRCNRPLLLFRAGQVEDPNPAWGLRLLINSRLLPSVLGIR
eukprot:3581267-Rhodomonas_salina.1